MYLTVAIVFAVIFFAVGCYIVKWMYREAKSKNGRVNENDVLMQMALNTIVAVVLGGIWPLSVPVGIIAVMVYVFYYKWFRYWVKRD